MKPAWIKNLFVKSSSPKYIVYILYRWLGALATRREGEGGGFPFGSKNILNFTERSEAKSREARENFRF